MADENDRGADHKISESLVKLQGNSPIPEPHRAGIGTDRDSTASAAQKSQNFGVLSEITGELTGSDTVQDNVPGTRLRQRPCPGSLSTTKITPGFRGSGFSGEA